MKNLKVLQSLALLLIIFAVACKPDTVAPLSDDGTVPGPIKNPQVKNLAGAAQITYELPDNSNLLYVKAVYDLKGTQMVVKSSFYKNSLIVEGFGDTNEREITLYAVSRGEKASEPVKVKITPLTPPVINIRNSLVIGETFGGIFTKFENLDRANVVIKVLLYDDVLKEWKNIDNHYSSLDSGIFATRGLDTLPKQFGIFVKDRWNNLSDTLKVVKKPIYEELLDKSKIVDMRKKNYPIPQEAPLPGSGAPMVEAIDYSGSYPLKNLFDNNYGNFFHTKEKVDQPVWIPFDLGQKAALSRFKVWQRKGTSYNYQHGNPHAWEIWGTNDPSKASNWRKLGAFTMIKPSNLPDGQLTAEDNAALDNGHEFEFPVGLQAYRYLAYKHIDAWSSQGGELGFVHIAEMTIWGQKQ